MLGLSLSSNATSSSSGDPTMAPRARALMDKGELSAEEVAGTFKISRRTLFRGLKAARDQDMIAGKH